MGDVKPPRGHWWGVSDLSAEATDPFAYFIALSDAVRFRAKCEDEQEGQFTITEHRRKTRP